MEDQQIRNTEGTAAAEPLYKIERLLAKRVSKRSGKVKYLARWVGYGPEDDTWELADKVVGGY